MVLPSLAGALGSVLAPIFALSVYPYHVAEEPLHAGFHDQSRNSAGLLRTSSPMAVVIATTSPTPRPPSLYEHYLPRRLYPGTYQNYCGPTPEIRVEGGKCSAHGWHGDDPVDRVDDACRLHDLSYCKCGSEFLARQGRPVVDSNEDDVPPMLSTMTALRFLTKPTLEKTVRADGEYFDCINKADRDLIATGVRVRGEMQRSGCSVDPKLSWFCDLSGGGTLGAFEKVNLSIFLKDLDFDFFEKSGKSTAAGGVERPLQIPRKSLTLQGMEQRREMDLQKELHEGKSVADAASASSVKEDEERIIRMLQQFDADE